MGSDFRNRRDFRRRACEETFAKAFHLLWLDVTFLHLDAQTMGDGDHRLAGDAVQKTVGRWRVKNPVLHEEDIGAGGFRNKPAIIEHQRIGIAFGLGLVLGDGADHVQTCRLGMHGLSLRRGPLPAGDFQADAFQLLGGAEIGRPWPTGDGDMDGGVLR
jgi:hypothetical protein